MGKRDDEQLEYAKAIDELDRLHADGRMGDSEHKLKREKLEAEALKAKGRLGLGCGLLVAAVPLLLVGGCVALLNSGDDSGGTSDTSGHQVSVRRLCVDQVRNGIGEAKFRDQSETSSPGEGGSTKYVATGRADVAGRSIQYRCEGTVAADADKTLTVRLVSAS